MVIKDLVEQVAMKARITKKDALAAIQTVFTTMSEALSQGEEVKITGFGQFQVKTTKARTGINPSTKEPIEIPESKKLYFKPSSTLKVLVREAEPGEVEEDEDY